MSPQRARRTHPRAKCDAGLGDHLGGHCAGVTMIPHSWGHRIGYRIACGLGDMDRGSPCARVRWRCAPRQQESGSWATGCCWAGSAKTPSLLDLVGPGRRSASCSMTDSARPRSVSSSAVVASRGTTDPPGHVRDTVVDCGKTCVERGPHVDNGTRVPLSNPERVRKVNSSLTVRLAGVPVASPGAVSSVVSRCDRLVGPRRPGVRTGHQSARRALVATGPPPAGSDAEPRPGPSGRTRAHPGRVAGASDRRGYLGTGAGQ